MVGEARSHTTFLDNIFPPRNAQGDAVTFASVGNSQTTGEDTRTNHGQVVLSDNSRILEQLFNITIILNKWLSKRY
jgi:hypothetical protein